VVAIAASVMYYVIHLQSQVLFTYALVLGYIAAALVLLQWTPQIITTFRAKVLLLYSLKYILFEAEFTMEKLYWKLFFDEIPILE